jgi:hypothetical protein
MKLLVLVTGVGRSGTSTMAGLLDQLGLYVPGPYLSANASNPKGFFESRWSVDFHNRITSNAGIHIFDGRPEAFDRVQETLTPELRTQLVAFLREQADQSDQVVVKDPRTVWTQRLWREAAHEVGLELRCVTMLRHPAEVVGSRTTYYAGATDEEAQRRYQVLNTARWVNGSLITERETRGWPRAFVRYADLLADWRSVAADLEDHLGLELAHSPEAREAVDAFIDPGLRRHAVTWDELETPAAVRDVAEGVWQQMAVLADSHGAAPNASVRLDELAQEYGRLIADAEAVSHDAIPEAQAEARREGARDERQRRAKKEARRRARSPEAMRVGELRSRDLIRVVVKRAVRRGPRP